jgi:apolipoprotein N-acyltransferase
VRHDISFIRARIRHATGRRQRRRKEENDLQMTRTRALAASVALGAASGLLYAAAFPSGMASVLIWIALVPLLIAIECFPFAPAPGFVAGVVAYGATFRWILIVPSFRISHFGILLAYFAAYWIAFAMAARFAMRRGWSAFIVAAIWVALDYVRGHAGFLSLRWATAAQSQAMNAQLLATAPWLREWGLTLVIVTVNVSVARLLVARFAGRELPRGELTVIAAALLLQAGGMVRLAIAPAASQRVRVLLVQPSILREEMQSLQSRRAAFQRMVALTRSRLDARPQLIVWPETAVIPGPVGNTSIATVQALVDEWNVPLLTGVADVEKFRAAHGSSIDSYNSAYFFTPRSKPLRYRKIALLPFAEYRPLGGSIPEWLIPRGAETTPGSSTPLFAMGEVRIGATICWENFFSWIAASEVQNGARLIVQLTNDNWFGRTAEPFQHDDASALRAAELDVPIVTVSNSGPSFVRDRFGRIIGGTGELFAARAVVVDVPLSH